MSVKPTRLVDAIREAPVDRIMALAASLVGAVFVLMGVVYGFRAAWQSHVLPPGVVVAGAIIMASAALAGGEWLWSRKLRVPAAGLAGSGLGTLYLSLYVGHDWYGLFGRVPTFGLLLLVTGVGAVFAVRRNSQLMASLGFLCGMSTPLLLSDGSGDIVAYFLFLGLLDCAAIYAAIQRRWVVLAWLSVLATFGLRLAWELLHLGEAPPGVASLSAAFLGGLFAIGALWPGLSKRIVLPFIGAAGVALVAMIPSVGLGEPEVATAFSLLAIIGLLALIRAVSLRRAWAGLDIGAVSIGAIALIALAAQWHQAGGVGWTSLVALMVGPIGSLWMLDLFFGLRPNEERFLGRVAMALLPGCLGFGLAYLQGDLQVFPVVAVALVASGWLVPLYVAHGLHRVADEGELEASESRARLGAIRGALWIPPLALVAASVCLALSEAVPVVTLCTGAGIYITMLAAPFVVEESSDRRWVFATALAAPILVLPMYFDWLEIVPGLGGVLAILMGMPAVLAVYMAGSEWMKLEVADRRMAHSVYLIVALFFASLAVPLQVEREWLTVGWAIEGAALAWASRSLRQPVIVGASLLLLALVSCRLVLNPLVLTYHLVDQPTLWNWILYGYGVPAACLFAASRWLEMPSDGWTGGSARRTLELAGVAVVFAMMNLQVSHVFADGGALTLWDVTVRAQLVRTLSWAVFGLGLIGVSLRHRPLYRWMGVGLLGVVVAKVLALDLWMLHGVGRVLLLLGVGPLFLLAAGVLQLPRRTLEEARG